MVDIKSSIEEFDRPKTYYELLGIEQSANLQTIKNAYLELAKLYHPDHNPNGDDRRMIQLNLIYGVLSNPDEKLEYDRTLSVGLNSDLSQAKTQNEPVTQKKEDSAPAPAVNLKKDKPKIEPLWQKEAKPAVISINYLKIVRVGLMGLLVVMLFYLAFYLIVKILQFYTDIPTWLLNLIPQ